jgi:thioredoxin 1
MSSFQELINSNKPVLVDFFATWCGPCRMMTPVLQDVAERMGDEAKVIKVDVDKNPQAAASFEVRGVPTLIIFKKGKQVWRQSGVVPAEVLIGKLKEAGKD